MGPIVTENIAIEDLTEDMAKDELTRLADLLNMANKAYHSDDDPMICLLYTSPSPRDLSTSRMPSSA